MLAIYLADIFFHLLNDVLFCNFDIIVLIDTFFWYNFLNEMECLICHLKD